MKSNIQNKITLSLHLLTFQIMKIRSIHEKMTSTICGGCLCMFSVEYHRSKSADTVASLSALYNQHKLLRMLNT